MLTPCKNAVNLVHQNIIRTTSDFQTWSYNCPECYVILVSSAIWPYCAPARSMSLFIYLFFFYLNVLLLVRCCNVIIILTVICLTKLNENVNYSSSSSSSSSSYPFINVTCQNARTCTKYSDMRELYEPKKLIDPCTLRIVNMLVQPNHKTSPKHS